MKTKKKLLAILNTPPGEPFIINHLNAVSENISEIKLRIAYGSTSENGKIKSPLNRKVNAFAIPNFDRLSTLKKASFVFKYPFKKRSQIKKFAVEQFFKRQKADIIHFHFAGTAIKWYNFLPSNTKFTFSIRGSDINVMPFTNSTYLEKLKSVAEKAMRIHVVNEELADRFNALLPGFEAKIKCIPTLVSSEFFDISNMPLDKYIIAIGRLHWIKGHRDLLLACHLLKKKIPNFNLEIIGEGDERQVLEYMIRDLGLTENVKLTGNLSADEIRDSLSRAAFLIQSSLDEGFPNSIAEAMAAGVPVISTKCGGIENVLNSENAFLSDPGKPGELAKNMELAIKHQFDRENWVNINKQKARENFSKQSHCDQFSEFWNLNG
ncbi:glycosyltransferase family 4 protein [Hyphobacterium sp. CCMP332]|nr:glycosyltransferase family 4 protein [Hyphobacterium sp. CCMP332]